MLLVFVFLVAVVRPLLLSATTSNESLVDSPWASETGQSRAAAQPVHVAIDEYQAIGRGLYADGTLQTFRVDTGCPRMAP